MKNNIGWVALLILAPFLYAIYLYPSLGDQVPIHFDIHGKADGRTSRNGIFLGPTIMGVVSLFVYFLLINIEKIDPKRASGGDTSIIKKLALFVVAGLSIVSLVILYSSSHENVAVDKLLFGALGLFFLGNGYFMPRLKQNYFAGYKLPWTLESEQNWIATHRVAGKWWMGGGIAQFLVAIFFSGEILFYLFMSITFLTAVIPIAFSYRFYKRSLNE
jgi:uncharacterized membrane protein